MSLSCTATHARGDALYDMGPWWIGQPRRIISEGRAALRLTERAENAKPLVGRVQ